MATVYLAQDCKHDRVVALKVLHPDLAASLGTDRFLREIKLAARSIIRHILPLFDSGAADAFLYYVMPYVEGESLRERLDREQQLPVDEALHHTAPSLPRSTTRTDRTSCIATSSPRTSCCTRARRWSWISGSPRQ
jgi:serine/threonine protein kinase